MLRVWRILQIQQSADNVENHDMLVLSENIQKLQSEIKKLQTVEPANEGERELVDSYEEVMQEEMRVMKSTYEGRLANLREEHEIATRVNNMEISKCALSCCLKIIIC